jgi:hypothetical protein
VNPVRNTSGSLSDTRLTRSCLEISNPRLVVIVGSLGLASNLVGLFLFHGPCSSLSISLLIQPIFYFRTLSFPCSSIFPTSISCSKLTQLTAFRKHNANSEENHGHQDSASAHTFTTTILINLVGFFRFSAVWSPSGHQGIPCPDRK